MNLKRHYKESWEYLRDSKYYIYIVLAIFILSSLVGFVFDDQFVFLDDTLAELIKNTEGLNTWQMITYIFFNNLRASLNTMILGLFFGVMPVLNSLINGAVLGYVLKNAWYLTGFEDFWRLLPHGIFELPAVFISLGLGLRIGMFWFTKNKKKVFVYEARQALKAFLLIVLPLLIIAAIIEGILIGVLS